MRTACGKARCKIGVNMNDEQKKELKEMAFADGVELSDDELDRIVGGYVYHDAGDPAAHRKEAFYVLDDSGDIIMRLDDMGAAKHWANNLRTSTKVLTAEEFAQLRKGR